MPDGDVLLATDRGHRSKRREGQRMRIGNADQRTVSLRSAVLQDREAGIVRWMEIAGNLLVARRAQKARRIEYGLLWPAAGTRDDSCVEYLDLGADVHIAPLTRHGR